MSMCFGDDSDHDLERNLMEVSSKITEIKDNLTMELNRLAKFGNSMYGPQLREFNGVIDAMERQIKRL